MTTLTIPTTYSLRDEETVYQMLIASLVKEPSNYVQVKKLVQMLAQGVIQPSLNPWAGPVVLVKKEDRSMEFIAV